MAQPAIPGVMHDQAARMQPRFPLPRPTAAALPGAARRPRRSGAVLWGIQVVLALLFLGAGAAKLAMPAAELTRQLGMPALFLRFIGVCEVLGAIGLVLPGLTRLGTHLTTLAAVGLVLIMVGASVTTVAQGTVATALLPLVVGLLAALVAYGRHRRVPLQQRGRRPGDHAGRAAS